MASSSVVKVTVIAAAGHGLRNWRELESTPSTDCSPDALGDHSAAPPVDHPTYIPAARPPEGRPAGADDATERSDEPALSEWPGGSGAQPGAFLD